MKSDVSYAGWKLAVLAGLCGSALLLVAQEKPRPGSAGNAAKPERVAEGDTNQSFVRVQREIPELTYAVKPKPLSPAVKKGLAYLVKTQQPDGGWNQGGGWRTREGGGRIEGPNVEDPSDVGNTCLALLALLRAGNTVTEGEYKDAVRKGLEFVLAHVEKADWESLRLGNVQGTQIQSKIGPYVDLFAANLLLAEFRGKAGDLEERLINGLEKTMTKIVRNQQKDGRFAGNDAWASTLSVGIANKGIARAKERGALVNEEALKKILVQATEAPKPRTEKPIAGGAGASDRALIAPLGEDAGIRLYRAGQSTSNVQDVVNSLAREAAQARQVLASPNASAAEKAEAERKLQAFDALKKRNEAVQSDLARNLRDERFLAGFGSNGGEEFLSFLNIGETLVLRGGKEWEEWDARMVRGLEKAQNSDGSWSGQHCITGRTFCTATALLVLMTDRTPFLPEVIQEARAKPANDSPNK